ncbi:MAG: hypothetical protein N2235_08415 [Fischerella sp.]|nr:hypothetical protein [Fischerella sp.]
MENIHFGFIGWHQDAKSDKIWGWFAVGNALRPDSIWLERGSPCYVFWGQARRCHAV